MFTISRTDASQSVKWMGLFSPIWIGPSTSVSLLIAHGVSDLKDAVITAVVNKRAGGMGLISGRKAFQRPMKEGIALLHAIQDVYLDPGITIA